MNLKLLACAAILFCISCGKEKNAENTRPQTQSAQSAGKTIADTTTLFVPLPATRREYQRAQKIHFDAVDTASPIPKINSRITLPLKGNKAPVVFKDSVSEQDETASVQYQYVGRIENPGFYIVEGSFWEWRECYLVTMHTGTKDTLWTAPVLSPDKSMMVNLSPPYGLEGDPNGIQLWKLAGSNENITVSKLKEIDQMEWIPLEVCWMDNHTLIFRAVTIDNFMMAGGEPKEKDVYYFKMKVK